MLSNLNKVVIKNVFKNKPVMNACKGQTGTL